MRFADYDKLFNQLTAPNGDTVKDGNGNAKLYSPYNPPNIFFLATQPSLARAAQYPGLDMTYLPDAFRLFCDMCQFPGTKWSPSTQSPVQRRDANLTLSGTA